MRKRAFFLTSKNPYQNLATEEYFFRLLPASDSILLFYINKPSVIMGRFQNPWVEIDLDLLNEKKVLLVRRQSGGGTVFHDEENLNWSIITPKSEFDLDENNAILKRALAHFKITAEVGARHGLYVNGKKISGVAFKETKDSKYHHGTLLIKSNLEILNRLLIQKTSIESKSIRSVSSSVVNLKELNNQISIHDLALKISEEFLGGEGELSDYDNLEFDEKKYSNPEWIYGETPFFKLEKKGEYLGEEYLLVLSILKGKIIKAEFDCPSIHPERVSEIRSELEGKKIYQKCECLDSLADDLLKTILK